MIEQIVENLIEAGYRDWETVQEVEFNRDDLQLIIGSVNNKPQGMSREINPEM